MSRSCFLRRTASKKLCELCVLWWWLRTGPCQVGVCCRDTTEEVGDHGKKTHTCISRTIQIRGDQTLHDLHRAIFKAYDRWGHHLYEFNVGKSPRDRSRLYVFSGGFGPIKDSCGDPEVTTIDSLGLQEGKHFGYIVDMGDYWPHELEVSAIEQGPLQGDDPIIIEKVGPSPPQYPEDEEDEENGEDE